MTAQSIVCGTCSAPVAYGRLSCPSCGELLASVAGARRPSSTRSSVVDEPRTPDVPHDLEPSPAVGVLDGQLALDDTADAAQAELPWAGAGDGATVEFDQRSGWDDDDDQNGLAHDGALTDEASSTAGHAWAVAGASMTGPTTPAYMPRPTYARAASEVAPPPLAEPTPSQPIDPPGAYVPPPPVSAVPAGPPAPARVWAGYSEANAGLSAAAVPSARSARDRAIDPSRIAEFVGSVSIAGAALASVGFLLPWASVMIGATGAEYFDRWGLAGPGHVLVVIAILTVLVLSVVRNPIPTWIRTGIGGLAVGSLLLGITWPYLLGPLDAAPGVLIDLVGAIALIGSGVLALATDRHAGVAEPV